MADYTFSALMKSQADMSAWKAYREELKRNIAATGKAGGSTKKLEAELRRVDAQLKKSAKASRAYSMEQKRMTDGVREAAREFPALSRALDLIANPKVAGIAAMAAGLAALKKAVSNFSEEQLAFTGVDAALANQGALTKENREELIKLSNVMEGKYKIANETFLDSMAQLLKLGSDESDIPRIMEDVKNLAGILGGGEGSLENAALLVSKAYAGSMETLSRYGIILDENATKAEKLEEMSRKLAEGGAGQLEARAKTLKGQWDGFKISLNNAFEAMGGGASQSGILQFALFGLGQTLQGFANLFPEVGKKVDGLSNKLPKLESEADAARAAMAGLQGASGAAGSAMEDSGGDARSAANDFNELAAGINAARQAQDALIQGRAAVALAEVDRDEATADARGQLTDRNRAEFNRRRAEIRAGAEAERLQAREGAVNEEQAQIAAMIEQATATFSEAMTGVAERLDQATQAFAENNVDGNPFDTSIGELRTLGAELQRRLENSRERREQIAGAGQQGPLERAGRVLGLGPALDAVNGPLNAAQLPAPGEMETLDQDIEQLTRRLDAILETTRAMDALRQAEARLDAQEQALNQTTDQAAESTARLNLERQRIQLESQRQGIARETARRRASTAAVNARQAERDDRREAITNEIEAGNVSPERQRQIAVELRRLNLIDQRANRARQTATTAAPTPPVNVSGVTPGGELVNGQTSQADAAAAEFLRRSQQTEANAGQSSQAINQAGQQVNAAVMEMGAQTVAAFGSLIAQVQELTRRFENLESQAQNRGGRR